MLEYMFKVILDISISASIAAIVIIGIRALLRNRLSKTFSYALWAILLLRLLIPFRLSSILPPGFGWQVQRAYWSLPLSVIPAQ